MTPPVWWVRTGAYLLVVAMFAFSLWKVEQVRLDDRAQQCVAGWAVREDIRDGIQKGAEALIAIAPSNAPRDRIVAYRAQILAARAEIPNPSCNLRAAKRRLGQ